MTKDEVFNLIPNDEVYWNDPDDGACSRIYKIMEINVICQGDNDPVVKILDVSGDCIECYASELR